MITLETGVPGSGKTLHTLSWVKAKADKEGREVFYSGIADLNLPWVEIDPTKWMDCPPNSIVVIDECQRVFRPRMHGSAVPEFVAQLETHRHRGIDLVFITQHPMLVDTNVRRLVGQHFHVVRQFGMARATIHEWASVKENCDKNRDDSNAFTFTYPKEVFGWYKSAEVHTHKINIPKRVWMLAGALLLTAGAVAAVVHSFNTRLHPQAASAQAASPEAPLGAGPAHRGPLSRTEYLDIYRPRIAGLAYTAPVYDEATKPTRAPYPAACVASASRCTCYTQQATKLDVPEALCRGIAAGGFFVAWDDKTARQEVRANPAPPAASAPLEGGSFIMIPDSHPRGVVAQAAEAQTGGDLARARGQNGTRPVNGG